MYKRIFITLVLVLMLAALAAQTVAQNPLSLIAQALAPLVVIIATPLITRLFKKLGIDIAESTLEPILMRIIEIIASVEQNKKNLSGAQKKELVTDMARSMISKADQKVLIKKYGSLETAVQAAFERSSVAVK
jgi:hypothetical protein